MNKRAPPASKPGGSATIPIAVAIIGLVGVLGAAVFANWDKFYPKMPGARIQHSSSSTPSVEHLPRSTSTTAGTQSPVVTGVGGNVTINIGASNSAAASSAITPRRAAEALLGTWTSPQLHEPHTDNYYRVMIHFERFGGEVVGTVTDLPKGGAGGHPFDVMELRVEGTSATFYTASAWCCEDDKEVPYKTHYHLNIQGKNLAVTRTDDIPPPSLERFIAYKN